MKKKVIELMQEIGMDFELDKPVGDLGPSKQQMVEIYSDAITTGDYHF